MQCHPHFRTKTSGYLKLPSRQPLWEWGKAISYDSGEYELFFFCQTVSILMESSRVKSHHTGACMAAIMA